MGRDGGGHAGRVVETGGVDAAPGVTRGCREELFVGFELGGADIAVVDGRGRRCLGRRGRRGGCLRTRERDATALVCAYLWLCPRISGSGGTPASAGGTRLSAPRAPQKGAFEGGIADSWMISLCNHVMLR